MSTRKRKSSEKKETSDVIIAEHFANQPYAIYKYGDDRQYRRQRGEEVENGISLKEVVKDIFLPKGFPSSVTSDYIPYQFWDTVQALASSLTAVLSTAAILKGAGVGNENATVLAASLSWILKDGVGMVGRILFAWLYGTSLDSFSKRWRLMADVLNDLAFCIDLTCAHLPQEFFVFCVCASSAMRAIVGVAGGGTRMAIVRHQARRENFADVAAKDGSQETLVGILSLIVSLLLLPLVENNPIIVWSCFVLFTLIHLYANYKAVKVLEFDVLNEDRLRIVAQEFVRSGQFLSVKEANERENVWPWSISMKTRFYGCSLPELKRYRFLYSNDDSSNQVALTHFEPSGGSIAFCKDITIKEIIYFAFKLERQIERCRVRSKTEEDHPTLEFVIDGLEKSGWNLNTHLLGVDEYRFSVKDE